MSFDTVNVPSSLSNWLEQNGVVELQTKDEPEPLAQRTYEYRMPQLDTNGEPPF